jgi:hypothetical protein
VWILTGNNIRVDGVYVTISGKNLDCCFYRASQLGREFTFDNPYIQSLYRTWRTYSKMACYEVAMLIAQDLETVMAKPSFTRLFQRQGA